MPPCPGVARPRRHASARLGRRTGAALLLGLCLADAPAELTAQPASRGQVAAVESRLATLQAEIIAFQSALSRARASTSLRDCCAAELARVRTAHSEVELQSRTLGSQFANSRESSARAAAREIDAAVRAVQEAAGKVQQARTVAEAGPFVGDFADAVLRYKAVAERLNPVDPQTPPECRDVSLGNFVSGQSPVPDFWSALAHTLREKGFSNAQINRLQEMFGHLDATALQQLTEGHLLPALTGRTVAERQQKLAVVLATAGDVQSCLSALGRADARRIEHHIVHHTAGARSSYRRLP